METVLEALSLYSKYRKPKPRKLFHFAKICRGEKVLPDTHGVALAPLNFRHRYLILK